MHVEFSCAFLVQRTGCRHLIWYGREGRPGGKVVLLASFKIPVASLGVRCGHWDCLEHLLPVHSRAQGTSAEHRRARFHFAAGKHVFSLGNLRVHCERGRIRAVGSLRHRVSTPRPFISRATAQRALSLPCPRPSEHPVSKAHLPSVTLFRFCRPRKRGSNAREGAGMAFPRIPLPHLRASLADNRLMAVRTGLGVVILSIRRAQRACGAALCCFGLCRHLT